MKDVSQSAGFNDVVTIAKTFEFSASHRLFRPEWSDEKNRRIFRKCANENGHGHNYQLEVVVGGSPDPETGMVFDASLLDQLVTEYILAELDHKNLDRDVLWHAGTIASSRNLVLAIWNRLAPALESFPASLERIRLWETSRIFAEYSGPR
ncbi:MAG: 6-carboxytetrahydropterin synthase [Bdellovibrionales bacterium]|nr:6-carboxytetrahydropterin synthase [Bdellovibrionales bacterium]